LGYVYDFENHVVQAGAGITMVYDGDGNRVKKTAGGVTTTYLVDTQNPTGHAQVIFESFSGGSGSSPEFSRSYVYGLERISQYRSYFLNNGSRTQTSYYVYDGHGSTRALTDPAGVATDTYDYDAFGNLLHSTGTTFNEFLFAGEQFDSDLNLYYNRARYLNVSTGRFWVMDSFEGRIDDPVSLHKYLYASDDPIDKRDPSGHFDFDLFGSLSAARVATIIAVTTVVTYSSFLFLIRATSQHVTSDQQAIIDRAIKVIEGAGFSSEATLLGISSFRRTDNFLNRQLLIQDQQYAATNKGFFTITVYDPFFRIPVDDVERAVVLFHESYHLVIRGEHAAYAGTWSNKERLGWTREKYGNTAFWNDVESETRQYAPELFP